jgi:hypothetical protein
MIEARDQTARAPITSAVCCCCGQGANGKGCLIRLGWTTELAAHRWGHRICAEAQGLVIRNHSARRTKVR